MQLSEFILALQEDVTRYDKEASGWYPKWVNRALRRIQQDRSWNCMRKTAEITVLNGTRSIALPADFKELARETPAVFLQSTDTASPWVPVRVTSRSHMDSKSVNNVWPASGVAGAQAGLECFIEQAADGTWTFFVEEDLTQDTTFRIEYYGFLPDLAADEDANHLTNAYEEMVMAKVKEIAFLAVNDPIAADFAQVYRGYLSEAWRDDQRRRHSGRVLRMGG